MHELSVTQTILETALKHAAQASAKKILHVNLLLGQFSDEREESIQFYWDDLAKGTPAQGATLHFERFPAEMCCRDCGFTFQPTEETGTCPACLSRRLHLISGDDVKMESIDVE